MELWIDPQGAIHGIYGEALDLHQFGRLTIRRGSYVEPTPDGQWLADLSPVAGPLLGPYAHRSQALAGEHQWLVAHWLSANRQTPVPG